MGRLGDVYLEWIDNLKREWSGITLQVTTETNPVHDISANRYKTVIEVQPTDTISQVLAEHARDKTQKICALNFASYKHPGGGFTKGLIAQEEAICYCTNLYPSLCENWQWYEQHKTTLNRGAYTDECIVSHNVTVLASEPGKLLPKDSRFSIDIITCAAPNWNSILKYDSGNQAAFDMLFDAAFKRVQYVMRTLAAYDYDTVILGAFGCGVFRNDPEAIAEAFYYSLKELLPDVFNRVVFAIPDKFSRNYRAFLNQFADSTSASGKTSVF